MCELCREREATERPTLVASLRKGIPLEGLVLSTCAGCSGRGFVLLFERMALVVADIPRRRKILALNDELKELTDPAAVRANRAKKSKLALLKGVDLSLVKELLDPVE